MVMDSYVFLLDNKKGKHRGLVRDRKAFSPLASNTCLGVYSGKALLCLPRSSGSHPVPTVVVSKNGSTASSSTENTPEMLRLWTLPEWTFVDTYNLEGMMIGWAA